MIVRRGEVWYANLNPVQGSEQAGLRPVLILQNDKINKAASTAVVIPFTTNLRRAALPSCVQVARGEGGLIAESVLLCHQLYCVTNCAFWMRQVSKINSAKSTSKLWLKSKPVYFIHWASALSEFIPALPNQKSCHFRCKMSHTIVTR